MDDYDKHFSDILCIESAYVFKNIVYFGESQQITTVTVQCCVCWVEVTDDWLHSVIKRCVFWVEATDTYSNKLRVVFWG